MTRMYRLTASMTDRIRYDEDVKRFIEDLAKTCDLTTVTIPSALEAWDCSANPTGETWDSNQEAKARFQDIWQYALLSNCPIED